MASWNLLDEKEELELHKSRLLNVEEKPFKRITKRLTAISALASPLKKQQPTPPPEGANGEQEKEASTKKDPAAIQRERDQLKDDLTLDFAAFDSSIARLQFLLDANARERERYQADQQRILEEGNTVRTNNIQLREQLEEAKATLAQRKKFDELAEKITSNRLLRPREDQLANLSKLEEECRELERESETYSETWRERREQFSKIMDEGMMLRRQIRDEKEEVERREGMNEAEEEDGEASRGGQTPRHTASGNVTPHPESGNISRMDGSSGGRTPARDSQGEDKAEGLKPRPEGLGGFSQNGSVAQSRDGTPRPQADDDDEIEEGEDVEMDEPARADTVTETQATLGADTPQITVDAPEGNDDKMEVDTQ